MHPILFEIPSLHFRFYSYGFLLVLGAIVAVLVSERIGPRWRDLPRPCALHIGIIIVVIGSAGGGLTQLLVQAVLDAGRSKVAFEGGALTGGMGVYFGGLVSGILGVAIYTRLRGLYWWPSADVVFTTVPLAYAFARAGCFLAGCCWGRACDLPWAVTFPASAHARTGVPAGIPLHPVQLYGALASLLLSGFLYLVLRRKGWGGQVALLYLFLYGLIRFLLEFLRDDPRGSLLGLSTSQGIALVFMAGAATLWPVVRRLRLPPSCPRP